MSSFPVFEAIVQSNNPKEFVYSTSGVGAGVYVAIQSVENHGVSSVVGLLSNEIESEVGILTKQVVFMDKISHDMAVQVTHIVAKSRKLKLAGSKWNLA